MIIDINKYGCILTAFTHNPEVVGSSPASATKKEHHPIGWCSFLIMEKRLEEGGGSCKTSVKKCPVDTFLARGRVHSCKTLSGTDAGLHESVCTEISLQNRLTHILTHNRIAPGGQVGIFLNTMSTKSEKPRNFQNF